MEWLIHQLWLTWHEIQREITIPHTITTLIAYGIVHGFFARLRRGERTLVRRLKNDRHKTAFIHVKKRHEGRFSNCDNCSVIQRHRLPEHQA